MDLHLNPYLVHLGPLGIRWYGFFMALSMAVGLYFLVRRAARAGVDADTVYNLALLTIVGGIVGARFVYVLTNWGFFAQHPGQIIQIQQGGIAIQGAMIGGLAAGMWYAARRELPFWFLADGMVPGACVGIFLVRIGNIFNGEILGHPAGILGGLRQPAQVYEMIMGLGLWVIYWRQLRRDPADGVPFWTFMLWYGVFRFCSEFFRDNPQYIIHYTNHYLGIGMTTLEQLFTPLAVGVPLLALRWRRAVDLHSDRSSPAWHGTVPTADLAGAEAAAGGRGPALP
jgi:phosphatidylglycerol:prolipoprotein diacylglycerol transferase